MTADDVRARLLPLPAPTPMPPKRDGTYQRGYDADDMRDYGEACYLAALADMAKRMEAAESNDGN